MAAKKKFMSPAEPVEIEGVEEIDEYDEISGELEEPDLIAVKSSSITTTDWTVETLVNQLRKGNFELSPQFQRRFAWQGKRKSQFIESLALNYPVPHIVLARDKSNPSKLIVLDGKQRLMTLAQFYGLKTLGSTPSNLEPLKLVGLKIKKNWNGETFESISKKVAWKSDLDALENWTIRSVIVSSWKSEDLLYSIFVRLNIGSLPLSPQELRQALRPGPFSTFADKYSAESDGFKKLLGLTEPDFRMRDVELLIRFIAFRMRAAEYSGNLKEFLDGTCDTFNKNWTTMQTKVKSECAQLEHAIILAHEIFGPTNAFRKYLTKSYETRLNRAVFDVVAFALAEPKVRTALKTVEAKEKLRVEFEGLCKQPEFRRSIETTTKSLTATRRRYTDFLKVIKKVTGVAVSTQLPKA